MSLPPKAVPKSAPAAGTGPGPGPSSSSQLRSTLTSVALPGAPVTPQAPAVPPPQSGSVLLLFSEGVQVRPCQTLSRCCSLKVFRSDPVPLLFSEGVQTMVAPLSMQGWRLWGQGFPAPPNNGQGEHGVPCVDRGRHQGAFSLLSSDRISLSVSDPDVEFMVITVRSAFFCYSTPPLSKESPESSNLRMIESFPRSLQLRPFIVMLKTPEPSLWYSVLKVPRPAGPPYSAHDITKGHPNLPGTPPGHASSPGLSQTPYPSGQNAATTQLVYSPPTQPMNAQPQSRPVSGPTLKPLILFCGRPDLTHPVEKAYKDTCSLGAVCSLATCEPCATAVLICRSSLSLLLWCTPHIHAPIQFATGPRPSHHQFFQRTQMQTARPTIPSNNPSIRPGSQTPAAAVYPSNQPIMMTMTPMPFPSPQTAQYYIPQYRHSTPQYVGPPQQYPVQPPGPSTFYPSPGPGEFPTPYPGPPYYPGQAVYTPSPPIIVPTPQQPPPAKREKKTIRIRDPNQGGKDITEEIMSGGGGSRNPTPPVGRPSSTPTPPQQLGSQAPDHSPVGYSVDNTPLLPAAVDLKSDEKPKQEPAVLKPSSPGLRPLEPPKEKSDPAPPEKTTELPTQGPVAAPSAAPAPVPTISPSKPVSTGAECAEPSLSPKDEPKAVPSAPAQPQGTDSEKPSTELPRGRPASPAVVLKAVNGLTDKEVASLSSELEAPPTEAVRPSSPPQTQPLALPPSTGTDPPEASSRGPRVESPPAPPAAVPVAPSVPAVSPPSAPAPTTTTTPDITTAAIPAATVLAPPPGLTLPVQTASAAGAVQVQRPSVAAETKETPCRAEAEVVPESTVELQQPSNPRKSPVIVQAASTAPKTWKKPKDVTAAGESLGKEKQEVPALEESGDRALPRDPERHSTPPLNPEENQSPPLPEENGEQEVEPVRNGAEHASETESSDSGVTPGDKDTSTGATTYVFQEGKELSLVSGHFMPACVQKPEGLPPIADVVLDKINQNKLPMRPLMNVGLRRPPPRKIIMNVSVNDEVQLKKAENAWKPGMKRESGADDPESQKTQELFRKVRSILNKLTPQMFNQLMKQVTDLTIDTEERLKGVIDLVFEKAIDEPSFSVAYGNMCRCLATLLLNRCQKEFEKDKVDDDVFERKQKELESAASASERERLQEELEEAKDKARRRSIGNIKFIGELFKLKMLTEAIMHDCVVKLLKNHDEESLECLCRLLTTIGKDLDFEKAKPRMDQYFNQMEKIVKERKTSSRIRFMLQDVIDLRLHNWVSRRADQGPKTIEQIHKEAKIEEQEEQRKVHQQLLSKDNKRRPGQHAVIAWSQRGHSTRNLSGYTLLSSPIPSAPSTSIPSSDHLLHHHPLSREETWNTVPMTKNSRTIDPTKIPKISKPWTVFVIQLRSGVPLDGIVKRVSRVKRLAQTFAVAPTIDDKIQLGPRAQINWVKGSSGGAGAKANESGQDTPHSSHPTPPSLTLTAPVPTNTRAFICTVSLRFSDLTRSSGSNLNRYSALQSAAPPQSTTPPSMPPDFDSRRSLSSRGSSGRERNDKPVSSAPSRTAPFSRGGSAKELLEGQASAELRREAPEMADTPSTPKQTSAAEDRGEPERSRARDSVKPEAPTALTQDKPLLSEEEMEKKCKSIIDEFLHINDYKVRCKNHTASLGLGHMAYK
ncbi:hypothetical protein JZ751_028325 [Albula glossodonta]|uniref:MIF4G domain-containing protein n=1 Tax=Albula glossodonta TaxID=121402 RepID=A0A8T2NBE1_9TELE|nr:hypothetical protein JZ751_028325 [Albula glossodonta]